MTRVKQIYVHPFPANCKCCPFYEDEAYFFGLLKTGRYFGHAQDHEFAFRYTPNVDYNWQIGDPGYDDSRLPSCPLKKWDWKLLKEREVEQP